MTAAQGIQVRAPFLTAGEAAYLGPTGEAWNRMVETEARLQATPLNSQPSAYVQAAWRDKAYGSLPVGGITAAVAGTSLFLRLRWLAPEPRASITDNDVFADAAAVLFPLNGVDAPLPTMGDEQHPVQAWHWRAGTAVPFVITAAGLGTVARLPNQAVAVEADWDHGRWTVVFSRPLAGTGVSLSRGGSIPCAIAIWSGARGERAGLKSHTPAWMSLTLP